MIKAKIYTNNTLLNAQIQSEKNLSAKVEKSISGSITITDHSKLDNLDYETSGHKGFASQKQLSILVPKDLSTLPKCDLSNRNSLIYIYDNEIAKQTTLNNLLGVKLRTVSTIPNDIQTNDYIFLKEKING